MSDRLEFEYDSRQARHPSDDRDLKTQNIEGIRALAEVMIQAIRSGEAPDHFYVRIVLVAA